MEAHSVTDSLFQEQSDCSTMGNEHRTPTRLSELGMEWMPISMVSEEMIYEHEKLWQYCKVPKHYAPKHWNIP